VTAPSSVPCLDFGEWIVPFPQRGHYEFLASDALRTTQSDGPTAEQSGVWLGRAESGSSVLLPVRLEVRRGTVRPVLVAVLHQGDELYFAGHVVQFHEVRLQRVAAGSRLVGRRCQQCRRRLTEAMDVVRCPLCDAPYCGDCWEFLTYGRCYSRGCTYSPAPVTLESKGTNS
jgi:hypothetical protein